MEDSLLNSLSVFCYLLKAVSLKYTSSQNSNKLNNPFQSVRLSIIFSFCSHKQYERYYDIVSIMKIKLFMRTLKKNMQIKHSIK